jgi:hypothetical protein
LCNLLILRSLNNYIMTQDYCVICWFLLQMFKKTSLREVLCTVSDVIVDVINILCCCLECYTFLVSGFYINGRNLILLN